ncbi:MAG: hypothetical protein H0U16_05715 [Actinobacteria bacterium]|nr:hypothetical protein [Actinomycetota bacterium]
MLKAEVTDNSIEIWLSRSDLALLVFSALMLAVLFTLAGWQVVVVALGVSIAAAGAVDIAQSWGIRTGHR